METTTPLKIVTHDKFCIETVPEVCGIVIFGASGDLSHRKLIPAIFELHKKKLLPKDFFILGFARTEQNESAFRKDIAKTIAEHGERDKKLQKTFLDFVYYQSGHYTNVSDLTNLKKTVCGLHAKYKTKGNTIFYLAVPPDLYQDTIFNMKGANLVTECKDRKCWTHIVIEKPFGRDFESACKLNQELVKILDESQIYRIDHYLGKETVQNILMFRFANAIFEPLWNQQHIDHIQITSAETLGIKHRAGYFERTGTLRDMFQNHMFQLLALVAIEPPTKFQADLYRDEKMKVMAALRPVPPDRIDEFVVRGQYGPGKINGKKVAGYREEKGVAKDSQVETYAAMKVFIDNWRWDGVPFYLRSGKRLGAAATEIAVQFKSVPHSIFEFLTPDQYTPNVLSFMIQPNEGISLNFEAKHPGPKTCMATLNLRFNYKETFHEEPMNAYVRLLLDCMQADQTLFVRQDMIDLSWKFLAPILEKWEAEKRPDFPNYAAGSSGPSEAEKLIRADKREWRAL